jgi:hypothetical protein
MQACEQTCAKGPVFLASCVSRMPLGQGIPTTGPFRRPELDSVPLPPFVPPQPSQPVEKPLSGPQWAHKIKLDGYCLAAWIAS